MRNRFLLAALLAAHLGVSGRALYQHGYLELFAFAFRDWPQFQIFVDLTVALVLLSAFVARDARRAGRKAWLYLVATPLVGSLAPLLYFVVGAFGNQKSAEQPPL